MNLRVNAGKVTLKRRTRILPVLLFNWFEIVNEFPERLEVRLAVLHEDPDDAEPND